MRHLKHLIIVFVGLLLANNPAHAQFTAETAYSFLSAQAAVYREGSSESVEKFVAYMTNDVRDIHVTYGREFTGKDHFRKNMPEKAKALLSYDRQISQISMGTNVAVLIFHEQSRERKRDGEIRDYNGRTIMVIDFNDEGLITTLRRYQD